MDFGEKPRRRIQINITSLVDILIVLLLFFMLTTQFIRMEVINLNLSGNKAAQSQEIAEDKSIIITLAGSGRFMFEGEEFSLLYLKDKIRPLLQKNNANSIVIFSKDQASVQDVVTAMDYLRSIGGTNISIAEDDDNAGE